MVKSGKETYSMYLGRYYHTVEEKGRVSLPRKFRKGDDQLFVITRGLDGGLFLFPSQNWQEEINRLTVNSTFTQKNNRDFLRLLTNDAQEVSCDRLGRILIPEYLRTFAKIGKQAVIVGSYSRIEIWDVETYHQYIQAIEPKAEEIAESMPSAQGR
jgi:MraZ protein